MLKYDAVKKERLLIADLVFLESVKKMPIMSLPVRTVFVPVRGGGVLISPGSMLEKSQLATLNGVTDIVGPSLLHCAGVPKAREVFAGARRWGPQGADQRKPDIDWTDFLAPSTWPYQEELALVPLQGTPATNECLFIHKKSKTLIVCDMVFNLRHLRGLGSWLIVRLLSDAYRRFAVSRIFMASVKDRGTFQNSIDELMAYDFDNIVMSHGVVVEGNGKRILREALRERGVRA